MMDERLIQLSKKLVKLRCWKWMPGMQGVRDCSPDKADYLKPEVRIKAITDMSYADIFGSIPDLTDPATLGALLSLVRIVSKDDKAYLCYFNGYDSVEWGVVSGVIEDIREESDLPPRGWFRALIGEGKTEGEALAGALQEAEAFYADYAERSNDDGRGRS
jgi:hypothetical protein